MKWASGRFLACASIAACALLQGAVSGTVECNGTFDIVWSTIECGGGIAANGAFDLHSSTIGQPDPGPMLGGEFEFLGGFWPGVKPCSLAMQGDINCDDHVNGNDLAIVIGNWLTCGPGDVNLDGTVNGNDLAIVIGHWAP